MMEMLLPILYLVSSVTFIIGLKMLGSPKTARTGNLVAAAGMALAIAGTMIFHRNHDGQPLGNIPLILAALGIGTVLGWMMAVRVKMTSMPQMVSFFNGMGGACAALISILETMESGGMWTFGSGLATMAGLVIGGVSFSGSIVAYGKLEERIKDVSFKGQQAINLLIMAGIVVMAALMITGRIEGIGPLVVIAGCALVYGILFVLPIGGADMPVVISLLNSFTGVAAACGGFLYDNMVMLIGGILVGSAGTLLTVVMCRAMNRSLANVLLGGLLNKAGGGGGGAGTAGGPIREVSATDAAVLMAYARKVVIVPGYGLAVAQAQHVCHQLEHELASKGVQVKYAIHPVAGRMPGHMNVLLAEADVSYDNLVEMEEINPEFATTDVVLVVGANDVVNPAARTDPQSPIYGMPILDVDMAKQVIILKRSMKSGYAGIDNELFYRPNCAMLFGDAKTSLAALVTEVKQL